MQVSLEHLQADDGDAYMGDFGKWAIPAEKRIW